MTVMSPNSCHATEFLEMGRTLTTNITRFYDDLINGLSDSQRTFPVNEIFVGSHWTLVQTQRLGMAYTYRLPHNPPVRETGLLTQKTAWELVQYLKSWNLMEASIGMAALNSLLDLTGEPINAYEYALERAADRRIAVVGHFPFLPQLKAVAKALWVIEKDPQDGDLPDSAAEEYLPQADMTLITGTAFINKTIPRLLELSRKCETILLGPTVPLSSVLFDYGVDIIGGVRVIDRDFICRTVFEGASKYFQLKRGLEFVLVKRHSRY